MPFKQVSYGAQVLQAALSGTELFYLSPLAHQGRLTRGGVPVLFPQFAESGVLPKHGWARQQDWTLVDQVNTADQHLQTYTLTLLEQPDWPHQAELILTTTVTATEFKQQLSVNNTGDSTFCFTGGLHPYFYIHDVQHASISGLADVPCHDRYRQPDSVSPTLRWGPQPIERLYQQAPQLTLKTGQRTLQLQTSGFSEWMIWNPGEAGAQRLADLPDADWQHLICIEPVCVTRPVWLRAGDMFSGTLIVTIDEG